ncbi:YceI family protein [Rhodovulum sp. DZ06]|uniref:YceI family protein n=1 Tax=Rhodovulum sp. DZ06 TaxID=3425126 RepID=UPI003D3249E5
MKMLMGAAAAALLAGAAFADDHGGAWTSVEDASRVAFGSVKGNETGEVHHFNRVSGEVAPSGAVAVRIDLGSVETNIDIRNERMLEHVFKGMGEAVLTGTVDYAAISALPVGATTIAPFEGALALGPVVAEVEAEMLVARLTEDRVLVTTADFIMLSTADLGIDGGIDALKELAGLSGITRVTPVAIRMVFEK